MELAGMEAAMYLRKSRADEGLTTEETLSRHQATLLEYAGKHGIHVIEIYPEVASGESLYARPQMMRLLEDIDAGRYDCVLCMDLDRLSRGRMRDQGIVLDVLKSSETVIVTPDKVYDLSVETDEQYAELKTFISRQEYKAITKRLHRGRKRSVEEGCYVNAAPYGYRNVIVDKKPTLEIHEQEAANVRLMFDWFANGVGCLTIARRLNDMGVPSATGIEFDHNVVKRILKNPVYIGKIAWGQSKIVKKGDQRSRVLQPRDKWELYDGLHPAIIEKDTWDKVQQIIAQRYVPAKRDGLRKSPLAGIVRCERCGGRMNRLPYHGTQNPYLTCSRRGCTSMTRLQLVEKSLLDQLAKILEEMSVNPSDAECDTSAERIRLDAVQKELSAAQKKKNRLYEFLEDGTYSKEEFRERMTAVKERIVHLEIQEREARTDLDIAENRNPNRLAEALRAVIDGYWNADIPERNSMLKSVIDVVWYAKQHGTPPTDFTLRIILKNL